MTDLNKTCHFILLLDLFTEAMFFFGSELGSGTTTFTGLYKYITGNNNLVVVKGEEIASFSVRMS